MSFTSFCRFTQPSRVTIDDVVFLDDEVVGGVLLFGDLAGDLRPPRVAVRLLHLLDLVADDLPEVRRRA